MTYSIASRLRVVRFILAMGWMLLIFVLSSQRSFPQRSGLSDDLLAVAAHLLLFGMLAILAIAALPHPRRLTPSQAVLIVVGTTMYGISDEVHQSFVAGRHASGFDVLVDGIGATITTVCWLLFTRLRDS